MRVTTGLPPARLPTPTPITDPVGWSESGVASWYGEPFHGRLTASGELYDMEGLTAAHRTLPFGTTILVENLDSGQDVTLRITDRGPFAGGRMLDVSRRAARELGMIGPGTARVRITIVTSPEALNCWEVQAGAFSRREGAEELRTRLARDGMAARVTIGEDALFRVRAGPIHSHDEARRLASAWDGLVVGCPLAQ
ncbi:MAG: septal ring lytic transglycosylase RlpA family protein [Gemmatimonadota bacterium]